METETTDAPHVGLSKSETGTYAVVAAGQIMHLLPSELQQLVQLAYDKHRVCADPFASPVDPEAPVIVEDSRGGVLYRTADFASAAHNTGVRA